MYLKKAKLYYTTLLAFFLDNDVVCENQDINDKQIVDTSHVEDQSQVPIKFCHYIKTSFLIFSVNRKAFLLAMGNLG